MYYLLIIQGRLISYAVEFSNGAIFKRLGFLTEKLDGTETIVDACRAYMTKGNAKIDPLLNCPRLISKCVSGYQNTWLQALHMIDKKEILYLAEALDIYPHLIEKDYALGCLLWGPIVVCIVTIRTR